MSLILPDEDIYALTCGFCDCPDCQEKNAKEVARAQARHMARECLDWWEGEADCYNVNQRKHFEAWLRQEGVM